MCFVWMILSDLWFILQFAWNLARLVFALGPDRWAFSLRREDAAVPRHLPPLCDKLCGAPNFEFLYYFR